MKKFAKLVVFATALLTYSRVSFAQLPESYFLNFSPTSKKDSPPKHDPPPRQDPPKQDPPRRDPPPQREQRPLRRDRDDRQDRVSEPSGRNVEGIDASSPFGVDGPVPAFLLRPGRVD